MKADYYLVIGKLEITKGIVINDTEAFENHLKKCVNDVDAASFILGVTRKYKLLLNSNNEKPLCNQEETTTLPFVPSAEADSQIFDFNAQDCASPKPARSILS